MAVEARHLSLFPPQLIGNREIMNPIETNANIFINNAHHHHQSNMGPYGGLPPPPGVIAAESLLPSYNSPILDPPKTAKIKSSDSGLTYNVNRTPPQPYSRKRSRDSINNPLMSYNPITNSTTAQAMNKNSSTFSFLGEHISLHLQQQQFDLDRLVSQHMEKVRMEMEEKRKRQAGKILGAIEVGMMKRLRAKEEEIEKIGRLNLALEERVKSLCIENQIWRDLAQTNESTANALRTNLEQVLAQVKDHNHHGARLENDVVDADEDWGGGGADLADDAQSYCGENDDVWGGAGTWRSAVRGERRNDNVKEETTSNVSCGEGKVMNNRMCRNCGKEESCVLLLPCRHLCLCTVCGSSLHTCPICKSSKNASVHVNMSS